MKRFARAAAGIFAMLMFSPALHSAAAETHIVAAGSTALLPLVKAGVERFTQLHPDVRISVAGGGSGTGLAQVAVGAIDIGDSDLPPPRGTVLHDHRVAVIGFAIIVARDIALTNVTRAQIQAIFAGQIANWREVGGRDEIITVINRPRSSGTRKVFIHGIMGTTPIADSSLTADASGTVVATVESTPGAISYVALSALHSARVGRLSIDGVAPTKANICDGRYPLWAYEHMLTLDPTRPEIEAFIRAIATDSVTLRKLGYYALSEMHVQRSDR